MGGNGKHRWTISFHREPKSSDMRKQSPPEEFVCPINGSLMSDPVIVSSGQTFERTSIQVCRELRFYPLLPDGTKPDFTTVIPNRAIKSSIVKWCKETSTEYPPVPDYYSVEGIVKKMVRDNQETEERESESQRQSQARIQAHQRSDSTAVLLDNVPENPKVLFSHATTEIGIRPPPEFYTSTPASSLPPTFPATPLPFTTRPASYTIPSPSSSSSSLENFGSQSAATAEEAELLNKMRSSDVEEQDEGVHSLRKATRTDEEARVKLCTPGILAAVRILLASRQSTVQINAAASLVNMSLERDNKKKIVRSGIVPLLIDVLKSGSIEAQEHAAGALFSLSLEDDNKTAIGVLGGLQPLLHALRSESDRTRHDSALALYHLTHVQTNRVKLVKLGAVPTLLTLLKSRNMAGRAILVICNLAMCNEGKGAMLDGNAVGLLVGMLRENDLDSEATRENVVAALYSLSQGSMRFKGLAREAGAVEVMKRVVETSTERAVEKARRMLQMMRGTEEEGEDDVVPDWERVLGSGSGFSGPRYRPGVGSGVNLHRGNNNSTQFYTWSESG